MKDATYVNISRVSSGLRFISSDIDFADSLKPAPALCTLARTFRLAAPISSRTPTTPSLPTSATSAALPSANA